MHEVAGTGGVRRLAVRWDAWHVYRSPDRHAPQGEALVVEAFERRFHRLDAEAMAGLGQERFHVRVMANGGGDDHVRARGETLEAGRDVDRRAEVVEAVVESDGDTGTVVDPCLEEQRPHTLWWRSEP